jgi:hypothetical protein
MTKSNTPNTEAKPGWLTSSAATSAVILSAALAGFGIASAFWPRLVAADPVAIIAAAVIIGVVAVSECAAALLLVHAANRANEGAHLWAWAARLAFVACTAANVLAGHYGAEAINTRLVAPQRAPFEAGLSSAEAMLDGARNSVAAFESRAATERADLERQLESERQAAAGFVTARARAAELAREGLTRRHAAERDALAADVRAAEATVAEKRADFEAAPKGFDQFQMWGFALLLELLKGLLVRVATPVRRRIAASGAVLPIDPAAYEAMTDEELTAMESRASAAKALAQHARRRRLQAA